jgi:hypothetical protein
VGRADGGRAATQLARLDVAPRDATVQAARADAPTRRTDAGAPHVRMDAPIDLGPSAPLAAAPDGVLIRTNDDDAVWMAFERSKTMPRSKTFDVERISPMPAPTVARGSRAYWISHGRLVRRDFSRSESGQAGAGTLEVLANDAYDSSRVAVRTVPGAISRDLVAYVARPVTPRGDRRARLWVERTADQDAASGPGRSLDLSDDAAGASSVALAGTDTRTWAVSLDARIAMSPLHARTIDLGEGGAVRYGPDVVVFVGEAEAAHTEIDLAVLDGEPVALVPLPKDAGGFGLALVAFGREPRVDSPAVWKTYPNGIKPALVAVGHLCGAEWVAYVKPTEASPSAPRVLVLAPLDGPTLGPEVTVVAAMRFASLAFAPASDGAAAKRKAAWLAWSADGQSRACALSCR